MPFKRRRKVKKPSLLKPAAIAISALFIVGGAYAVINSQNSDESDSGGLDKRKTVKNVGDVEEVIAQWVESNPQAIIESLQNMQRKSAEDLAKNARKNIALKKDELFNDKKSPQYAPKNYDVTIVEFYDYACGYCKKGQQTISKLIKSDKKVRVIYRNFPILGEASIQMATVSLAVNLVAPKSFHKFHKELMKSNKRGTDAALAAAKAAGIRTSKITSYIATNQEKLAGLIQDNLTLGASVGISGTPGFIIGDELIPGALGLEVFKEKIAKVRAK